MAIKFDSNASSFSASLSIGEPILKTHMITWNGWGEEILFEHNYQFYLLAKLMIRRLYLIIIIDLAPLFFF